MKHIKKLTFFCLAFAMHGHLAVAQDSTSTSVEFRFAQYLLLTQQYQLATLELERIHFSQPLNKQVQKALIESNRMSGNYLQGLTYANRFSKNALPGSLEWNFFQKESIRNALLSKHYQSIPSVIAELRLVKNQDSTMLMYADNISLGMSILTANHPTKAYHFHTLNNAAGHDPRLQELADAWAFSNRKSPSLAAALSTVLPGAGKVYAGKWKDGLVSFLFVGANAYSSYRGFKNAGIQSPYGWLFGSIGTGFYLGNIYGAHKAAKDYNKQLESHIKSDVYSRLLLIY